MIILGPPPFMRTYLADFVLITLNFPLWRTNTPPFCAPRGAKKADSAPVTKKKQKPGAKKVIFAPGFRE